MIQTFFKTVLLLLTAGFMLSACSEQPADHSNEGGAKNHDEAAEDDVKKGPNRGRLLEDGDFAVEVTIFEQGTPPQFRLFAYQEGTPLSADKVKASIVLTRLDGEENHFAFAPAGDYMFGDGVVTEPHSFDVTVEAKYQGRTHRWAYDNYEGRTLIAAAMANEVGIKVEPVGPQTLETTLEVLGRVEFAPDAQSTLRARYPGKILEVMKNEGQKVTAGEILARVESNESLRAYEIKAPMDGVMVKRMAHAGDVVFDSPLFVVGDLSRLRVDFHIYPKDLTTVRPGQKVTLSSIDGRLSAETELDAYLPTTESATQTMVVHALMNNPDGAWVPGMTVKGSVVVERREVPRAVRSEALQRFRDFTVVFARVKDTYEVRMLELGQRTPEWAEVLGGIKPGQPYVTGNSFLIKADIEKSGASHDH
jgi:cobalt-zinc-cadmium efflux system membrane fusion protein